MAHLLICLGLLRNCATCTLPSSSSGIGSQRKSNTDQSRFKLTSNCARLNREPKHEVARSLGRSFGLGLGRGRTRTAGAAHRRKMLLRVTRPRKQSGSVRPSFTTKQLRAIRPTEPTLLWELGWFFLLAAATGKLNIICSTAFQKGNTVSM